MSEHRRAVEEYAARVGVRVEWEGEVGFGRECVGLVDPAADCYIDYVGGTGPPAADVPDAYHKNDSIAVLGRGPVAEAQLAAWVAKLEEAGATYERLPKVMPDVMALLGHTTDLVAMPADPVMREAALKARDQLRDLMRR